jgi:tRNA-specific 2-thiouridylase
VRCNGNTKFRDLLRRGEMLGCDLIATGHYARVEHDPAGGTRLLRALDANKDQSYFLWALPPELLPRLLFPLGELTKPEVRARARELGLVTADKPESMEICFVPDGDYPRFLSKRLGAEHAALQPGPMVTTAGEVVGEHEGYARYTVGQRKGLGGGRALPLFVLGTHPERRELVVGSEQELHQGGAEIGELNWLGAPPLPGDPVLVQLRHRARAAAATVTAVTPEGISLRFEQPQRAVSPGQSAVIFADQVVLGGGRIRSPQAGSAQPHSQSAPAA